MSKSLSYSEFIKDIQKGKPNPIYFLFGEETFFIDRIVDYFEENIIPENLRSFNQTIVYGKDISGRGVVDLVSRFPMMSEHQLVIVKEVNQIENFNDLASIIKKPVPSTILVLTYPKKSLDKRIKINKDLLAAAKVFESQLFYDNQIPELANQFFKEFRLQADQKTLMLLAEYIGTDISKLYNEIKKLSLVVPEGHKVTPEDVQQYIGISKEFSVFELQKTIAQKDEKKSFYILHNLLLNSKTNPPLAIISMLFNFVQKCFGLRGAQGSDQELARKIGVNPFFLKDYKLFNTSFNYQEHTIILEALLHFDLLYKGVIGDRTPPDEKMLELLSYIFKSGEKKSLNN